MVVRWEADVSLTATLQNSHNSKVSPNMNSKKNISKKSSYSTKKCSARKSCGKENHTAHVSFMIHKKGARSIQQNRFSAKSAWAASRTALNSRAGLHSIIYSTLTTQKQSGSTPASLKMAAQLSTVGQSNNLFQTEP